MDYLSWFSLTKATLHTTLLANAADPDQIVPKEHSDLSLQCLLKQVLNICGRITAFITAQFFLSRFDMHRIALLLKRCILQSSTFI